MLSWKHGFLACSVSRNTVCAEALTIIVDLQDLKAQLRICVVGSVQLTQLQQGLKKYNNDPIELMKHLTIEEGKHRYRAWVLPGIVIE